MIRPEPPCTVQSMSKQTLIVTCATKDQLGNVIAVGGVSADRRWQHTSEQAITYIRSGTHEYRVARSDGPYVRPYGDRFLRSDPDKLTANNLESLPSCSSVS
jgi:hypothetical protein